MPGRSRRKEQQRGTGVAAGAEATPGHPASPHLPVLEMHTDSRQTQWVPDAVLPLPARDCVQAPLARLAPSMHQPTRAGPQALRPWLPHWLVGPGNQSSPTSPSSHQPRRHAPRPGNRWGRRRRSLPHLAVMCKDLMSQEHRECAAQAPKRELTHPPGPFEPPEMPALQPPQHSLRTGRAQAQQGQHSDTQPGPEGPGGRVPSR